MLKSSRPILYLKGNLKWKQTTNKMCLLTYVHIILYLLCGQWWFVNILCKNSQLLCTDHLYIYGKIQCILRLFSDYACTTDAQLLHTVNHVYSYDLVQTCVQGKRMWRIKHKDLKVDEGSRYHNINSDQGENLDKF